MRTSLPPFLFWLRTKRGNRTYVPPLLLLLFSWVPSRHLTPVSPGFYAAILVIVLAETRRGEGTDGAVIELHGGWEGENKREGENRPWKEEEVHCRRVHLVSLLSPPLVRRLLFRTHTHIKQASPLRERMGGMMMLRHGARVRNCGKNKNNVPPQNYSREKLLCMSTDGVKVHSRARDQFLQVCKYLG